MLKYNYKGAAALWDEYYNLCIDDWSFGDTEKQQERRNFMHCLTRGTDKELYINYAKQCIIDYRPTEDAKNRYYDFDFEWKIENLIDKIITFRGVKE